MIDESEIAEAIAAARAKPPERQEQILRLALTLADSKTEFTDVERIMLFVADALMQDGVEPPDQRQHMLPKHYHGLERTLRTPGTFQVAYNGKTCDLCGGPAPKDTWMRRRTNTRGHRTDVHYPSCPPHLRK
jgi:hypothetical protein